MAAKDILNVTCIIDPDWRTLECIRANGGAQGVNLVRLPLTLKDCRDPLAAARPEVLLGNACHKTDTLDLGEVAARHAEAITHLFTHSCAQVLILEAPVGFAGTDKWVTISCLSCLRPAALLKQLLCQRRRSECLQASVEFLRWRLNDGRIPIWLPSSRGGNAKLRDRPAKNLPSATFWANEGPSS